MAKKKSGGAKTLTKIALISGIAIGSLIIIFFGLILILPAYQSTTGFETLNAMTRYAASRPEFPPMENKNLIKPKYIQFYTDHISAGFGAKFKTLKSYIGLAGTTDWSPGAFQASLTTLLKEREAAGHTGNIAYRISPKPGEQFVVWGDILGAYHSLVRDLSELKKLGYIDDSLKISKPNTTFVFMGDVPSRAPFGIESVHVIMRLMEVNPGKVFYLRGNHEDKKYWHSYGMKAQLEVMASALSTEFLVPEVDRFFQTLPLGLYARIPETTDQFVRFSHLGRKKGKPLREKHHATFLLADQKDPIDIYVTDRKKTFPGDVKIEAIIRSEKKRNTFQTMDGMRLLSPDRGATAWNILSAPTLVNQKGLKFFHDAFAIITIGAEHKGQWSITLHSQDSRTKDGFKTRSYQFFTGTQMELSAIAKAAPLGSGDGSGDKASAQDKSGRSSGETSNESQGAAKENVKAKAHDADSKTGQETKQASKSEKVSAASSESSGSENSGSATQDNKTEESKKLPAGPEVQAQRDQAVDSSSESGSSAPARESNKTKKEPLADKQAESVAPPQKIEHEDGVVLRPTHEPLVDPETGSAPIQQDQSGARGQNAHVHPAGIAYPQAAGHQYGGPMTYVIPHTVNSDGGKNGGNTIIIIQPPAPVQQPAPQQVQPIIIHAQPVPQSASQQSQLAIHSHARGRQETSGQATHRADSHPDSSAPAKAREAAGSVGHAPGTDVQKISSHVMQKAATNPVLNTVVQRASKQAHKRACAGHTHKEKPALQGAPAKQAKQHGQEITPPPPL